MMNSPQSYHSDRYAWALLAVVFWLVLLCLPASATSDYARQTGYSCSECHMEAIGGGQLTVKGQAFLDDMRIKGLYRPLTRTQKVIRLIVRYIHLMTAIAWFGTILYVHILLKPAYASKGLPRGELMLGWLSISILSITGVLLTISRVPSLAVFYKTRFGILLSIKIILFLVMVLTAVIVTGYIGPRMRKRRAAGGAAEPAEAGNLTADELMRFDGREGRPAYVAYKGSVYDLTGSRLWKNGSHLQKHSAGHDLTEVLKTAPHGEEKLLAMPRVGNFTAAQGVMTRPFYEKLFYFFAYMNLVFVFLITFVIALWRYD